MEQRRTISISKHDDNFDFFEVAKIPASKSRVRVGSKNPNSLKFESYLVISANRKFVYFDSKYYDKDEFFEHAKSMLIKCFMVLTEKEKNLLIELSVSYGIKIVAFEECYPIFESIRYVDYLPDNINEVNKRLNNIRHLGLKGRSAYHWFSTLFRYKQERVVRIKCELDNILYFSCHSPYQEVFKFKEERANRIIYALDFNSMYADCMMGNFADPKNLNYKSYIGAAISIEGVPDGFYRVKLCEAKNTFFLKFHPFKYAKSLKSYSFELTEGDSVEVFLPKKELLFYGKYFARIELIEGIASGSSIAHPLVKEVEKLHATKNLFPSTHHRAKLSKLAITVASSVSNPRRYTSRNYKCLDSVIADAEKIYSIKFDPKLTVEQRIDLLVSNGRLRLIEKATGEFSVKFFCNDGKESLYSIYSTMVSNSRVKIISLIERLLLIDSVEICYSNVDSLHISIDIKNSGEFESAIKEHLTSDIGGLKIEAIADRGYWFDLGRYWLFKGQQVVKHSNFIFNTGLSNNPYVDTRVFKKVNNICGFKYTSTFRVKLEDTFSYKKKLSCGPVGIDNVNFRRYYLDDVITASVASSSMYREKICSYHYKSSLFRELSTVKCSSNATHKK